jgi:hypothetical protein
MLLNDKGVTLVAVEWQRKWVCDDELSLQVRTLIEKAMPFVT